jgi:FMN phosphatase YigB (HAD superfamily)
MAINVVVFDVGETLFDETRLWGLWADWLGVPRLAFFAALGAVIERGWHHRRVFDLVAPGFDLAAARRERGLAGDADMIGPDDLYPDALPCLQRLTALGYRVGIVGNQLAAVEPMLRDLPAELAFIASAGAWGVEKPAPAFFQRVVELAGTAPSEIAYVGDRLDNDILPARDQDMAAIFLRRGPWGMIHARRPEVDRASAVIGSLAELPDALAACV